MAWTSVTLGSIVSITLLLTGCATKEYVRTQVGATEARLTQANQRLDGQEARLGDTAAKLDANRQRIDGFDARIGEIGAVATQASTRADEASGLARDARRTAESAAEAVRDAESRLSSRIANRNRFSPLDTRSMYFDFGRIELRDEAVTSLREIAQALREDPNVIVELLGHTDAVGGERANLQLSRERVDAVVRYLVQKEGIELRRIHTVGLGKAVPVADNNTREGRAKNRRVDIRLLSPQS